MRGSGAVSITHMQAVTNHVQRQEVVVEAMNEIKRSHREVLTAIIGHLQSTRSVPQTPPSIVAATIHLHDNSFSQTEILKTLTSGD